MCHSRRGAFAVGTAAAIALLGLEVRTEEAIAADPAAASQLIETSHCLGCNLHSTDFLRQDLLGAALTRPEPEGTNFYYANLNGA